MKPRLARAVRPRGGLDSEMSPPAFMAYGEEAESVSCGVGRPTPGLLNLAEGSESQGATLGIG
jgi:hypothetical protein